MIEQVANIILALLMVVVICVIILALDHVATQYRAFLIQRGYIQEYHDWKNDRKKGF